MASNTGTTPVSNGQYPQYSSCIPPAGTGASCPAGCRLRTCSQDSPPLVHIAANASGRRWFPLSSQRLMVGANAANRIATNARRAIQNWNRRERMFTLKIYRNDQSPELTWIRFSTVNPKCGINASIGADAP